MLTSLLADKVIRHKSNNYEILMNKICKSAMQQPRHSLMMSDNSEEAEVTFFFADSVSSAGEGELAIDEDVERVFIFPIPLWHPISMLRRGKRLIYG